MKVRVICVIALAAALPAVGWYGVRIYTTPAAPQIRLDGVADVLADLITGALNDVRANPRSGAAWGKLAMALDANETENGIVLDCYSHAARFDPANPAWPYLHGVRLLTIDQARAVQHLQQALALAQAPEDRAAILFRLSQALIEDRQFDEAERHVETLRSLDSGPRTQFVLGLLALARDDRAAAKSRLMKLTAVPMARKRAHAILASLGDADAKLAHGWKEQAAKLPPDDPWPDPLESKMLEYKVELKTIAVYWGLKNRGRDEEAFQFLRNFVARSPNAEACFTLGMLVFDMNELDDAEKMFRQSVQFEPRNVKAHLFLGSVLLKKGEKRLAEPGGKEAARPLFADAVASLDRSIALQQDQGNAHLDRGLALKHLNRTDEAIRALRHALLLQPETAEMHLQLGEALAESGQAAEAIEHLENAATLARAGDTNPRKALEKWRAKSKNPPK